jgi:hypothetical protein
MNKRPQTLASTPTRPPRRLPLPPTLRATPSLLLTATHPISKGVIGCPYEAVQRPIRDEAMQEAHVWFPDSHHLPAPPRASPLHRPRRGRPPRSSFPRQPGRDGAWREDLGEAREMARCRHKSARGSWALGLPPILASIALVRPLFSPSRSPFSSGGHHLQRFLVGPPVGRTVYLAYLHLVPLDSYSSCCLRTPLWLGFVVILLDMCDFEPDLRATNHALLISLLDLLVLYAMMMVISLILLSSVPRPMII